MGSLMKEFKFKKSSRVLTFLMGFVIAALGVGLNKLPNSWYGNIVEFLDQDRSKFDLLIQYWYGLVCLGIFICLMSAMIVFYTKILVYDDYFVLYGNRSKRKILFTDIRKIEDYTSGQKKGIKIYFKDGQRSIYIDKNNTKDYSGLFHLLKERHKISVLGDDFPDNIKELEFDVTKDLKVSHGTLVYKEKEIEFSHIANFSVVMQERTYNFGIIINFTRKKEKDLIIKATEMDHDDAFYTVLSTYCKEI